MSQELINVVYWGFNPLTNHLLTSWDIQVVHQKLNGKLANRPLTKLLEILDTQA